MNVAIVQARMGSTRLPGKVLMLANHQPLLGHLLKRLGKVRTIDCIVVATSDLPQDNPIADFCRAQNQLLFRGHESDVLDRYYQAALKFNATTVIRITADCPLIDPAIVDHAVELHDQLNSKSKIRFDLVTNRHPLTFPDGMDVDVMPFNSLAKAWEHATLSSQREHVIPYFWDHGLQVHNFTDPTNGFLRHRWTLDYIEDYQLIQAIIESLEGPNPNFNMQDILNFLMNRPELVALNAKYIPCRRAQLF